MRQKLVLDLFMVHRAALVDYASGIVGDRARAEDVVQEAWLRLEEASRHSLLERPAGYLYRIVRNLALDGYRRVQREGRVVTGDSLDRLAEVSCDECPSPETTTLYRDQFDLLREALAELPERTRVAVEMHRIGGCKLREIAAFLGVSVPMAHVLVSEGVQHCKRRLGWP